MIYFDHASTCMPKPDFIIDAIQSLNKNSTGSPYRSIDQSLQAGNHVEDTRRNLAKFLGVAQADKLAFTFNATHGLNIIIKSILKRGDHVILSCFEHNAVLRPIHHMVSSKKEITFSIINSDRNGVFTLDEITNAIRPNTKLIIWNHASNVIGSISPVDEIANIARKRNILMLLDCSQTVGVLDIDLHKLDIDFTAGTCHKGLLSLPGLGFIYVKDANLIDSLIQGGGGYNSNSLNHPSASPLKFEAGTQNYFAIASLNKALEYLRENKAERLQQYTTLNSNLVERLQEIEEVLLYGDTEPSKKLPITSFNIKNIAPIHLASMLYKEHQIITRAGIHCAPLIHKIRLLQNSKNLLFLIPNPPFFALKEVSRERKTCFATVSRY